MIHIENDILSVDISPRGGTLQSIFHKQTGLEYLWQGDRTYWGGRAPNLFPFVGRLYQERYLYCGTSYSMKCHGFLGKSEMIPEQTGADRCVFVLSDSPETLEIYPFPFSLRLEYILEGNSIRIRYAVTNCGEKTMYCGFGGHPGFNVPLESHLCFEDYAISFPEKTSCNIVNFSQGVLTVDQEQYTLEDDCRLPLKHGLFHHDAVVFANAPRQVTLSSEKSKHGVTVAYPDMPYVGFWHKPKTDAPFVCIEPWSVLPGREGVVEDLETMADMTAVEPGKTAINAWSIMLF